MFIDYIDTLVFHIKRKEQGEKKLTVFTLAKDGMLTKEESGKKPVRFRISRGDWFFLHLSINHYTHNYMPERNRIPYDPDNCMELYLYIGGHSYFSEDGKTPSPAAYSLKETLYHNGIRLDEFLFGLTKDSRRKCGADVLEVLLDFQIPEGYEAYVLAELYEWLRTGKEEKDQESAKHRFALIRSFIPWLLHQNWTLPMDINDVVAMLHYLRAFRQKVVSDFHFLDAETATLFGANFLFAYDQRLAISLLLPYAETSSRACALLADHYFRKGRFEKAREYQEKAAFLNGYRAHYVAAMRCAEQMDDVAALEHLRLGMERGEAGAYGYYGQMIWLSRHKKDGPFASENPKEEAMRYFRKGVSMGDTGSMVTLAKILLEEGGPEDEEPLELLLRACRLGQKKSFYLLADYYRHDHEFVAERDLRRARTYAEEGLRKNPGDEDPGYVILAQIDIDEGNVKRGLDALLSMARRGVDEAYIALGQMAVGGDSRFPCDDPYSLEALRRVEEKRYFYKAVLWRTYPEIVPVEEAVKNLIALAGLGEALAIAELEKIARDTGLVTKEDIEKAKRLYEEHQDEI